MSNNSCLSLEQYEDYMQKSLFSSISNAVFDLISVEIINMRLPIHSKINVSAIAKELHISSTPVIEACEQLKKYKLVETRSSAKGYYVAPLYSSDVHEIIVARGMLEEAAAVESAETGNLIYIEEMKELAAKFQNSILSGSRDSRNHDDKFHYLLILSSNNNYIIDYYKQLSLVLKRCLDYSSTFRQNTTNPLIKRMAIEHFAICNALELGIGETARLAVRRHMQSVVSFHLFSRDEWKP